MRWHTRHKCEEQELRVWLNGKLVIYLTRHKDMNISIDVEDNAADLQAAVDAVNTAVTNLQNSTLAGLTDALTALNTAIATLGSFQISFTASVVPPAAQ